MISIIAISTAALLGFGSVQSVGVVPAEGRTEVVITVDGAVSVRDYLLQDPARIVLDISGARHSLPQERFMNLNRGGVLSLRASQFGPQVVRVVVDLAGSVQYDVQQDAGEIRVSFRNPTGAFEPWSSGPQFAQASPARRESNNNPVAAYAPPPLPQQQAPISVSFRDTPMLDVLATFADFAGRSIVAGTGVTGDVTADIRNQPWDIAMEAILSSYGLAAREMPSGIILVESLANIGRRTQEEEQLTQAFPVRFISVDSVVNAIRPLLPEGGAISKSPATNTLLVTAGRSTIDRISRLMQELDVRTAQVTIAAKIIFVDRSRLEALGFHYDLKDIPGGADGFGNQLNQLTPGFIEDAQGVPQQTNNDVVLLGGNSIAALGNANARVAAPSLRIMSSLLLNRFSLVTFIEALQQHQMSDIQASPVITTLDHREAYIQVGQRTPIRVIDAQSAGGEGTNVPRARVETEETGTILRVTPHVTGNQVLLELHAEMSEPVLASSDVGFIFNTRQSETQILLNDGETAVISGLTRVQKDRTLTGIPILMDLPLIGALFRTTTVNESKQDLLIMITPYIQRDGL